MGLLSLSLPWSRNNPSPEKGPHFYVDLDEPHRTYAPGAEVTGSVVLKLAKPQRANAVIAKFQGFVYIKNPLLNGRGVTKKMFNVEIPLWLGDMDPGSTSSHASTFSHSASTTSATHSTVNGSSRSPTGSVSSSVPSSAPSSAPTSAPNSAHSAPHAAADARSTDARSVDARSVAGSAATAYSAADSTADSESAPNSAIDSLDQEAEAETSKKRRYRKEGTLPAGEHQFPFEFHLPDTGLMSSLTFERGSISYLVSGILRRPARLPQQSPERSLAVTCPLDVSALPPAKLVSLAVDVGRRRARATSSKTQKKDNSRVLVQVELPTKGYIRGEEIPIRMSVHHQWLVHSPAAIVLTLVRLTRLFGDQIDAQTFRKDLDQTVLPLYTDPKTLTAHINGSLRVPADAFPSMRHRDMVSFQYMIEVALDITGKRDLQKYVSTGPSYSMIDTVDLKHKSGMVSAWTEVVIGTCRSMPAALTGPRPDSAPGLASERSIYVDLSSSSSMRSRPSSSPRTSPRNSPPGIFGVQNSVQNSIHSSHGTPTTTPPHAAAAQDEKAALAAREAARVNVLLPSMPEYPTPGPETSAPAAGSSTAPLHSGHDKQELERQHLQTLATAPDDFVPQYSEAPDRYADEQPAPYYSADAVSGTPVPSAPPAPSAPPSPGPLAGPSAPPSAVAEPTAPPPAPIGPSAPPESLRGPSAPPGPAEPHISAPPDPAASSDDHPVSAPPFACVPSAGRRELPLSAPPG